MIPRRWPRPPAAVNSCERCNARLSRSLMRSARRWWRSQCLRLSWIHLQRAALDRAATLEQLGQIDTDGFEPGVGQLPGEPDGSDRMHDMATVRDRIQAEHISIGTVYHDGVGEQGLQMR